MADFTQPLRILMTVDAVGGVWTYALDLIRAMPPEGVEFLLAGMGPAPDASKLHELSAFPNVQWAHEPFGLEWMDNPWKEVSDAGTWLLRLAQDFCPDLIHLNGYVHASLPWKAPVLVVGHSCVLSWWRAVKHEPVPPAYDTYKAAVRTGLQAAVRVVAPSAAMKRNLIQEYGAAFQVEVIHNGRDFAPESSSPAKLPWILSAGRIWDKAKNVSFLDGIADQLDWPVRLAGETCAPQQTVASTGNARYLGRLNKLAMQEEMTGASIYAAPALYEPFGLSILEAAASRCALVLSDIPSLRELWQGVAIFVPVGDSRAWIDLLNWLLRRPDDLRHLGFIAALRAKHYTAAKMAKEYLRIYQELTSPSRTTPALDSMERMVIA